MFDGGFNTIDGLCHCISGNYPAKSDLHTTEYVFVQHEMQKKIALCISLMFHLYFGLILKCVMICILIYFVFPRFFVPHSYN